MSWRGRFWSALERLQLVAVCLSACAAVAIPIALAKSSGAGAGFSGGPAGYAGGGGDCTGCHAFTSGNGSVELLGMPRRYRAGEVYDLTVRVSDAEQAGAGFEISVEGTGGHVGSLLLSDPVNTQHTGPGGATDYVTQTENGYDDSLADWITNGGSYEYHLQWQAPAQDEGSATLFVAGNAVNNATSIFGDRYYATWVTTHYAEPGDADGDTDLDLLDFAAMQRCFADNEPISGGGCDFVDLNGDGFVALDDAAAFADTMSGPTAPAPAGFVLADPVRGGLLYDTWWTVVGADEPVQDHPLWASRPDTESNDASGAATWHCKECHGWDYAGVDGAYGSGPRRTGIEGVYGTALGPRELFALLVADPEQVANGHDLGATGMTADDVWDVVKMTLQGVVDTSQYIAGDKSFIGDEGLGDIWYARVCESCHGFTGTDIDFEGEHLGGLARRNPWRFLHKTRFGHPGSPMPSLDLQGWDIQRAADIGALVTTVDFPD